ncbi:GNAT family N-acetyltransferase [Kineococcus sp. TRM81007]|uniref:GNAT family N-acetyltransferase n=1 Tax=Kineococcus sp. TRM81007 TaxID=2925831 RepID=UPI001F57EEEE|nr:GNAT family N-acetyltransferase [Kineococcus sp. TRM81007]MCI2239725.1 GNAT family N-acetyltransferase [Kineococcus sp. TRM81007]
MDEALSAEWDDLAVLSGAPPFLRPGWIHAWMSAFEPRRALHALTIRRDGRLAALLPVVRKNGSLHCPTNAETPVMGPVALDAEALHPLLGQHVERHGLTLRFSPDDGNQEDLLRNSRARGLPVSVAPLRRSPCTSVQGDWEEFQEQTLTASRRRDLRRNERRLAAIGELRMTSHDLSRDLIGTLQRGLELEAAGWKGDEGTAVLSRPATTAFYRSASTWAASAGLLRLYFLTLDGEPIAFSLNLEQNGTSYGVKTAYAPAHRAFGPGVLMLNRLIAEGFSRPDLHTLEHLGEDDPFKREFSTGVRRQSSVRVFPRGTRGRLEQHADRGRLALATELRRRTTPETRRSVQRLLSTLRR